MTPKWYQRNFETLHASLNTKKRLYIALSAGVDSQVLLDWLHHFKAQLPPIEALHVNHLLHGEYSYTWANFAKEKALSYGFEFTNFEVAVNANDPKGVEAAGREARYLKMANHMCENSVLLVAHHQSDQAETVLFRLIRGAGVKGLGAMKSEIRLNFSEPDIQQNLPDKHVSVDLIRPFLNIPKSMLIKTAQDLQIKWMDDYSNSNLVYARNQIRNGIFPEISRYFPHYEASFAKSAQFLQEAQSLLDEIAIDDAKDAIINQTLVLEHILRLSDLRQNNLLRFWLNSHQMTLNDLQLSEIKRVFLNSEYPAPPQSKFILKDRQIRIHDGCLYIVPVPLYLIGLIEDKELTQVQGGNNLEMLINQGVLNWEASANAPNLQWWLSQSLTLKERQGGERFDPIFRDKSQSIKKILHELNLPHWQRENIYYLENEHQEIVWVSYIGISKKIQSQIQTQLDNTGTHDGVMPCL